MKNSGIIVLPVILFCVTFFAPSTSAQETGFARYIVDSMSAPGMYGRGYVNHGSLIASEFLSREFFEAGIMPFSDSYSQEFSFPMNTFPGAMVLNAGGRDLIPGIEFTVKASSPSVNRIYEIILLDSALFDNPRKLERRTGKDPSGSMIAFNRRQLKGDAAKLADSMLTTNFTGAGGYMIINPGEKLIWSVSPGGRPAEYPVVEVLEQALPRKRDKAALTIDAEFIQEYPVKNIVGFVPGHRNPDSVLVISAHYDHLGMMGRTAVFPGANDNASGVAMMLDLARYFADSANRPSFSVAFMAFAGEEAGLKGSEYYTENPVFPLGNIKFLINLDMVGTGSEGITVVNGEQFPAYYDRMAKINADNEYLLTVRKRGESCNSDHCPFYKKGVPAVFIYSMGKEHREYHTLNDRGGLVPFSEYEDIFRLLRDFICSFEPELPAEES
jgi:hypothetical protein